MRTNPYQLLFHVAFPLLNIYCFIFKAFLSPNLRRCNNEKNRGCNLVTFDLTKCILEVFMCACAAICHSIFIPITLFLFCYIKLLLYFPPQRAGYPLVGIMSNYHALLGNNMTNIMGNFTAIVENFTTR
jgi:hypothetical protein